MNFVYTRQHVFNRGIPPTDFLEELVNWGRSADKSIFEVNDLSDIYSSVYNSLGPYPSIEYRRGVMLEVMRVLAGFESSWNWEEGIDKNNPTKNIPSSQEAGAWQVSFDALVLAPSLQDIVIKYTSFDPMSFQVAIKSNHIFAMEFISRLLRVTTHHNGPVLRHEIDPWLRKTAVMEFVQLCQGQI